MSSIIGLIIINLLHRAERMLSILETHTQTHTTHTNTEAEKHTLHSLAGKLTLSGDEVVGSMVALKESRRMTC